MEQGRISLPAPGRPGIPRLAWVLLLVVALIAAAALSDFGDARPQAKAAGADAIVAAQALAGEFFVLGATLP